MNDEPQTRSSGGAAKELNDGKGPGEAEQTARLGHSMHRREIIFLTIAGGLLISSFLFGEIFGMEASDAAPGRVGGTWTAHRTSFLTLFAGLAFTALIGGCLVSDGRRSARMHALIEKLSQELICRRESEQRFRLLLADAEEAKTALETHLRQAKKMEALGTLAGGIVHDLNNFLTTITVSVQTARMDLVHGHPAVPSLDQINEASQHATGMVRQILSFARDERAERKVLSLEPVIRGAVKLLRSMIPPKVTIEERYGPTCPKVLVNLDQVQRVVLNLGANAAHAMREGGGRLEISLDHLSVGEALARCNQELRRGEYALITVSDVGHGMDAETLARIFDPFFTTKPRHEGTGLGLSIVRNIVRDHGGSITVSSQPGQGTIFDVYLPAAPVEAPAAASPLIDVAQGKDQHVLMVGEVLALNERDRDLLERLGHRISVCVNPHDALDRFRESPAEYDCVVSELAMLGMSGLELAAECRKCKPGVPFILTGSNPSAVSAESLREFGISELIVKPFPVRVLAGALQRALSGGKA